MRLSAGGVSHLLMTYVIATLQAQRPVYQEAQFVRWKQVGSLVQLEAALAQVR